MNTSTIGLRIRIPDHPAWRMFYTPPSRGFGDVLTKTVKLQLQAKGIPAPTVAISGPLPELFGLIETQDLQATAEALREVFEGLVMWSFVQLYYHDARELVFRPLDQTNTEPLDSVALAAAIRADQTEMQALRRFYESGGQSL